MKCYWNKWSNNQFKCWWWIVFYNEFNIKLYFKYEILMSR